MHNLRFIRRRLGDKAPTIIAIAALASGSLLALGVGLLLLF